MQRVLPPDRSILVIVPALNEEEAIADVVRTASRALGCDVLVIDDGSTDGTAAAAAAAGARVLSHPFNLGVGAALRSGFRYAVGHPYDVVLQLDGDGQHDVDAAAALIDTVLEGGADIAVGSRFAAGYRASVGRRMMMRVLANVVSRRLGVQLTDTTSGFRAFAPRVVARFAESYPTAYLSDTVEALLLAADAGFRVEEVAVRMSPRTTGRPSSGTLKSIVHLARLSLVIVLHPVRRPPARRGIGFNVQA